MNFFRTRVGNPFAQRGGVVRREQEESSLATSSPLNHHVYPQENNGKKGRANSVVKLDSKGKSFDDNASLLENVFSDSDSTAESSREVSLDDDDEDSSVGEEHYTPTRTFQNTLESIFHDKAHKTVLLNASQLKEVHNAIATDYTRILLHESSSFSSATAARFHDLDVHIRCANHILDQFWEAQVMILQTSMAATAQETIFQVVQDYLIPRLLDQIHPIHHLSLESTAKIISWSRIMKDNLGHIAPDLIMREEWSEAHERLIQYYLNSALRTELKVELGSLLDELSENNIQRDVHGNLFTGLAENVSHIINHHEKVAYECLPEQYRQDVLMMCNKELATMVSDWTIKISSEWQEMSSAFSCAIINDMVKLLEYIKESDNSESSKHLVSDISELSVFVTQLLCKRIIHNLREPESIIDSIGSATWENQATAAPVDCVVATFQDFFTDLEQWLRPGRFFPSILKYCFDLCLSVYLESFFAHTMAAGVNDPSVVAAELELDYLRLVVFFNGQRFSVYHCSNDFYPPKMINDRLRILQYMAALVDPTNLPEYLSNEVQQLFHSFREKEDGKRAVLHLASLRHRSRSTNTAQWLELIQLAEKDHSTTTGIEVLFMLPDVRASKMWRKISSQSRFKTKTRQSLKHAKCFSFFVVNSDPIPDAESVRSETTEHSVRKSVQHKFARGSRDINWTKPIEDTDGSEEYGSDEEGYFEGTTMAEF